MIMASEAGIRSPEKRSFLVDCSGEPA
jgi:hypothetical protein